jgi:hypothetical protein
MTVLLVAVHSSNTGSSCHQALQLHWCLHSQHGASATDIDPTAVAGQKEASHSPQELMQAGAHMAYPGQSSSDESLEDGAAALLAFSASTAEATKPEDAVVITGGEGDAREDGEALGEPLLPGIQQQGSKVCARGEHCNSQKCACCIVQ